MASASTKTYIVDAGSFPVTCPCGRVAFLSISLRRLARLRTWGNAETVRGTCPQGHCVEYHVRGR